MSLSDVMGVNMIGSVIQDAVSVQGHFKTIMKLIAEVNRNDA